MRIFKRYAVIYFLCGLSLVFGGFQSMAAAVAAPEIAAIGEGNTAGNFPFDDSSQGRSMRYQQVFDSSIFSQYTNGIILYDMSFRAEGSATADSAQFINSFQINASTTSRAVDSLSPVFSQNVGPDDQIIFGPKPVSLLASGRPERNPEFPSVYFTFETPFYYNPQNGNLLLDFRNFSGSQIDGHSFYLDGHNASDSVSSMAALDVNAMQGSPLLGNSFGYVAAITFAVVPEPSTNILLISGLAMMGWVIGRKRRGSCKLAA